MIDRIVFLTGMAFALSAGGADKVDVTVEVGAKGLVAIEYQREVLGYCGLGDPDAVRGFLDRKEWLIKEFSLGEADQLQAISDARQAAYAEWQNRGLGGFRGWCRKEGKDYTSNLKNLRNQID